MARRAGEARTDRSPRSLLKDVKAEPIAQSNLVAVTAKGSSAVSAQNLANAVADSAVEVRTGSSTSRSTSASRRSSRACSARHRRPWPGRRPAEVELAGLRTLRAGDNPTIRVDTPRRQADLAVLAEAT